MIIFSRIAAIAVSTWAFAVGGLSAPLATADPAVKPYEDVDTVGWRKALAGIGATNPDLRGLYDIFAEGYCTNTVDQLRLGFTLTGANPPLTRIGMTFVCPSRAYLVDDALTQLQETNETFARACATPAHLRTTEQAELVDAVPSACYGR